MASRLPPSPLGPEDSRERAAEQLDDFLGYVTMYRYELDPGSSPEVNKTSNEKTRRKRTTKRLAAGPLMR
jgi:hypothetical protein